MRKTTIAIIVIILAAFLGLVGYSIITKKAEAVDYSKYNFNSIIEANEDNGGIGDHIRGNPKAPVLLFEYGDFQCSGCASLSSTLQTILTEYGDLVGVVYRSFLLDYHQNGTAAAAAAEAAGLQGYWEKYSDLLFSNQSVWQYAGIQERQDFFVDLFERVSDGQGDVEKFKSDLASKAVKRKVAFDMGIGQEINVQATPSLYLDGEFIDLSGGSALDVLKAKINQKLKDLGIEKSASQINKTEK